jgi:hypothetical protein
MLTAAALQHATAGGASVATARATPCVLCAAVHGCVRNDFRLPRRVLLPRTHRVTPVRLMSTLSNMGCTTS